MYKSNEIRKSFIVLLLVLGALGLTNCRKCGCDYSVGDRYLTGTLHYSKNPVKIPKWPGSNVEVLDVNAYFVNDDSKGEFYDTIVVSKSSVPNEYRVDGKNHVAVSLVNTVTGTTTLELRHDVYKLKCIEKIDE